MAENSRKYKVIHIVDPGDGEVRPLIIKKYKVKGQKVETKPFRFGKKEAKENAKHLGYGGWIMPAIAALSAAPGIINGFRGLFGSGIADMKNYGALPAIVATAAGHPSAKGGRIYLGRGTVTKSTDSSFDGPGKDVLAYTPRFVPGK